MEKPSNYSQETIRKIVKKYEVDDNNFMDNKDYPNIVYVLSESFSDPANLQGIEVNPDPIEYIKNVQSQTLSGKMLSNGYGGGTANIEFETMTSFSMEPLNQDMTTPYPMIVAKRKGFPSIISYLNEFNYNTVLIHPFDLNMYKRNHVYKNLGIDKMINYNSMDYKETIENNPYLSDDSSFNQTIKELQSVDSPSFVNLVTMQAHMPYEGKYSKIDYQINNISRSGEIINYIQDISYVTKAVKTFLEKVDNLDRRTIVVFYGDHLPGIYGKDIISQNSDIKMHETPFFIYDNKHEIQASHNLSEVVSPMYFSSMVLSNTSMKISGYYNLVRQLNEVLPAFEKDKYYINDKWEREINSVDTKKIYNDFEIIQYDILQGNAYSQKMGFFDSNKK